MKKLFFCTLFSLMFCIFNSNAQEKEDSLLTYETILWVDSTPKDVLYNRAIMWVAETYKNSNESIQVKNKELGQIVVKGIIDYNPKMLDEDWLHPSKSTKGITGTIEYTLKIFVKDNKYKCQMTNFIHKSNIKDDDYNFGLITDKNKQKFIRAGVSYLEDINKEWNEKAWKNIKFEILCFYSDVRSSLDDSMKKELESENNDW